MRFVQFVSAFGADSSNCAVLDAGVLESSAWQTRADCVRVQCNFGHERVQWRIKCFIHSSIARAFTMARSGPHLTCNNVSGNARM
mmetsp:Transcript_4869/g.6422  ORF Transcript_4869/g.6422 Transcript_4869/m.6422 type:complete len:85 (-) Transcript_4869:78-332(-)